MTEQLLSLAASGDLEGLGKLPRGVLAKPDATGMRAMHVAAQHGHVHVLEWLVEDGRDVGVNTVDEDARTPLHWAAWHGQTLAVEALVEMGTIVDRTTRTGFTALHYACFAGKLDTVEALIRAGAKIDAKDESSQTPQEVASRFNKPDVVAFFESGRARALAEEAKLSAPVRHRLVAGTGGEESVYPDPIVETVQNNEFMNLERIVHAASKLSGQAVDALTPEVLAKAANRQTPHTSNNTTNTALLTAAVVLLCTTSLLLGMVLASRRTSTAATTTRRDL
ncbi:hypothetical protein BASA81_011019 [Batrachochytrium salamandrivorans]|nr:hypothetical protein BASA81_011019 [Batrachochytrium salamandrivorans]